MKAVELIPKLVTARSTGNDTVKVVLRLARGAYTLDQVKAYIEPQYGPALFYEAIFDTSSDVMSQLIDQDHMAYRCTFDLDAAIIHLMGLDPNTSIRT